MVNKTALENGIRIVTRKLPHIRSVSMGVWIDVGARDESERENGLSHFIEHMIFKGTRRRSAYEIAKAFDVIGGHTNAFTTMESTCYHAKVMDAHTDTMVDILLDILLNSVFDPVEMDRERPVILQEIGMVEDSPEEYLHQLAEEAFWRGHPMSRSILGTEESIEEFDAEAIRDFFGRFYQPDRILISAVGNLEHTRFVDVVAPAFSAISRGSGLGPRVEPQAHASLEVHARDLEQVHLALLGPGLSITDPRRYACSLMNTVLGGNMSSRLFQSIREQRGLAYSIYSYMTSYVDTGMFGICTAVDPKNARLATELILAETEKLCKTPMTQAELRDAKSYTLGCIYLSLENADSQMMRLAQNEIHFGRHIPLEDVIARIEVVTADEIQELALSLFPREKLGLTALGSLSDETAFEGLLPMG